MSNNRPVEPRCRLEGLLRPQPAIRRKYPQLSSETLRSAPITAAMLALVPESAESRLLRRPTFQRGCISNLLQSDARKYSYSSAPLYGLEGRKLTFGPINQVGLHPVAEWDRGIANFGRLGVIECRGLTLQGSTRSVTCGADRRPSGASSNLQGWSEVSLSDGMWQVKQTYSHVYQMQDRSTSSNNRRENAKKAWPADGEMLTVSSPKEFVRLPTLRGIP